MEQKEHYFKIKDLRKQKTDNTKQKTDNTNKLLTCCGFPDNNA